MQSREYMKHHERLWSNSNMNSSFREFFVYIFCNGLLKDLSFWVLNHLLQNSLQKAMSPQPGATAQTEQSVFIVTMNTCLVMRYWSMTLSKDNRPMIRSMVTPCGHMAPCDWSSTLVMWSLHWSAIFCEVYRTFLFIAYHSILFFDYPNFHYRVWT